jgi:hypothetical protein
MKLYEILDRHGLEQLMNQYQNFLIIDQYFSKVVLYGFKIHLLKILKQDVLLIEQQFLILLLNLMNDNNNNQFGHLLINQLKIIIIIIMVSLLIKIQHIHDNLHQIFHILIHQLLIVHLKMLY